MLLDIPAEDVDLMLKAVFSRRLKLMGNNVSYPEWVRTDDVYQALRNGRYRVGLSDD